MHKLAMSPSLLRGLSILTGATLLLVAAPASADVELAPMVVIDLSAYDGTGFDPMPAAGQLDSDDWSVRLSGAAVLDFGESAGGAGSDFARGLSMGGVDDPGMWAFDVDGAGLIAFGIQPTDQTFTPGQVVLRLINNTGAPIDAFQVEYTVWINNDTSRSSTLNFFESADDATYNQVGADLESPVDMDADGFVGTDQTQMVMPAEPIADGSQFYIQWEGNDGEGAGDTTRDEFGIEGITIRLLNVCGNGLLEGEEACDDGLANIDTGMCTTTCTVAACGDGFVQDGVEECDDMNTDDGDGCAADCTTEEAGTGTGTGGTGVDETAGTGGSGEGTDAGSADSTEGGATNNTNATNTTPGDDDADGSDGDGGGEDDDTSSCSCRSSSTPAPMWGVLGLIGLGLARRRRR